MKRFALSLFAAFIVVLVSGQVPNKINYQAVVRNSDGTIKSGTPVTLEFRIYDMGSGGNQVFEEIHIPTTDEFGRISLVIGEINDILFDWSKGPYSLEVIADGTSMGTSQIVSVPYALMSRDVVNNDDADPDPSNEIQDLQLEGNVLTITGNDQATPIVLAGGGDSQWNMDGDSVTITDKNVGIGTASPSGKLVVMGDGTTTVEEPLFEVKKQDGQTVFAVYNDSVRVFVNNESTTKGVKGGFAVGGYNSSVKGSFNEYLRVTPDSVRIYVDNNPQGKGVKGGFAVGGYSAAKSSATSFMSLTPENYLIGHESGQLITDGMYNSTLGYQAGSALTTGSENIFLGYQSGFNNTDGNHNTFIGYQAGYSNTSGYQNSFIGYRAGHDNTTGLFNLFVGYEAGLTNTTGSQNMFMGYRAGASNKEGQYNMFLGIMAGAANTSGNGNLFIGPGAGFYNTTGNRNIFVGNMAGNYNVSGSSNLFFGEYAGYNNVSGFYNIFIGTTAGGSNTSGHKNIFIGDQAGYINTTGYENSIVGYQSGYKLIDGKNNVFMGFESGYTSNGSNNVYIGSRSGKFNRGSGNIFIGTGAAGLEDSISNTLVIDNTIGIAAHNALIYGNMEGTRMLALNGRVGVRRAPSAGYALEVEGEAFKTSGTGSWAVTSDVRVKREIEEIYDAAEVMMKLRPVRFRYTEEYLADHPGVEDKVYVNFIAQEYREVFPESVRASSDNSLPEGESILVMDSYNAQIYSIKAVQDLILENQKQKEQIEELYELIRELKENRE